MQPDPASSDTPAAALLRPPAGNRANQANPASQPPPADPSANADPEVEPDGTEDPLANADDGVVPAQGADSRAPRSPLLQNQNPDRSR